MEDVVASLRLVVGLAVCELLSLVIFGIAGVELHVEYPVARNFSIVTLSCTDDFGDPVDGVSFYRNGTIVTPVTFHGTTVIRANNSLSLALDQAGEGRFHCSTSQGNVSETTGLAGSYYLLRCATRT